MLEIYERNSLKLIFERVTPDKVSGVVETLMETYKSKYNDSYSMKIIEIIENAITAMNTIEKISP